MQGRSRKGAEGHDLLDPGSPRRDSTKFSFAGRHSTPASNGLQWGEMGKQNYAIVGHLLGHLYGKII